MPRRSDIELPPPDALEPESSRVEALWNDVKAPMLWASGAFLAMGVVVFAATTERGDRRLAELPAEVETFVARGAQDARTARARETEIADRRLAMERTQLEARVAELERNVGEVTGSISRAPSRDTTGPGGRELPATTGSITAPRTEPSPPPAGIAAPAGGVTLATRSMFGVDIGAEANLQLARQRWQRAVERHGGVVATLDPIVVVRETPEGRVALHVVAGPVADVQEAAVLCARLRSTGTNCSPTSYEGQRLLQR